MGRFQIILLLYVLCLMPHAFSQKVTWSLPLSDSKLEYIKVLGQNDNGFFVLRGNHEISSGRAYYSYRNAKFLLSFYSYDMRKSWEQAPEPLRKDVRVLTYVPIADRLAEISLEWNKQEKKFRMLSRFYYSNGGVDTTYRTLNEDDISSVDDEAAFTISSSKDMNSFLITYENNTDNSLQKFTTLVCNEQFALVKKNAVTVLLSRKYFNASRFLVSNNHDVFLFGIKTDEERKSHDPDRNYFTLYKDNGTGQWNEYPIRSPEKFLTDAGIAIDEMNKKVVVTGFYAEKSSYSIAGVFYYDQDISSNVADPIGYAPFLPSFQFKFSGEKKENYNHDLVNYAIDRIILRNDGGDVIIAEAVYTTEYSYYDYYLRTYINKVYYHNDNIIELSVNKDGTMSWSNIIRKEQTSENRDDAYVSYAFGNMKGKLRYIFNRYLKRKTQVMLSSTDALGNEKLTELFGEEQDIYILPTAAKQVDENLLVIPAYKGNQFHLAGISF